MSHLKLQRISSLNNSQKQLQQFTIISTNSATAKEPTATTSTTNTHVQNHFANNCHNNRGQQNIGYQTQITANRSQFHPHGFNYRRVVGYNHNNSTRNACSHNNNTNHLNQNYNLNKNNGSTFN